MTAMSVETARALEQMIAVNDLQRKEIESLRAVLVHIECDITEWRTEGVPWSGDVLNAIEKRVREKLHEPPSLIDDTSAMPTNSAPETKGKGG